MPEAALAETPAPAAAPVATPAAEGGSQAPAAAKGLFDHMALAAPKEQPAPELGKTEESGKTVEPQEVKPSKVFAGRFKTPEELEVAYQESSNEGLRLYQESRQTAAKIAEREAKIAELEDQIKLAQSQPAFKELTQDEVKELLDKDPIKASEYLADKKLRDRDLIGQREKMKQDREQQARQTAETQQFIVKRGNEMAGSPDKYPDYEAL